MPLSRWCRHGPDGRRLRCCGSRGDCQGTAPCLTLWSGLPRKKRPARRRKVIDDVHGFPSIEWLAVREECMPTFSHSSTGCEVRKTYNAGFLAEAASFQSLSLASSARAGSRETPAVDLVV